MAAQSAVSLLPVLPIRPAMAQTRIIIIGAGIVGLATAMEIQSRYPGAALTVLEKEPVVASHQTGHNSGVIHSGIYYKPGSLKARLCVSGAAAMIRFCEEHRIPVGKCGKVIVATEPAELPRLSDLMTRGRANGVSGLRLISQEELRELEPHAAGIQAIHVPGTAITDFRQVAQKYAELIRNRGGEIRCGSRVSAIGNKSGELRIATTSGDYAADYGINCAGLNSDRIGQMAGCDNRNRIVPFRGEYYQLTAIREHLVRGLIYPVPDPRFPFLGVHFTRKVHGGVEAGPNAVFAFKREGYRKSDISLADTCNAITFPGFWRMARLNWRSAVGEYHRSLSTRAFLRDLRKLVPALEAGGLEPGGAGVRAQSLDREGRLVDDFVFAESSRMMHVLNVPSPAATASLAIARAIADRVATRIANTTTCADVAQPMSSPA